MRAYQRFIEYAKIYTTSNPDADTVPTTEGQKQLGQLLVGQLHALGLSDAQMDAQGYVYAHLAATPGHEAAPALGLLAHLDTSDDAPGENVQPQLHPNYDGKTLDIGHGVQLDAARFSFLPTLAGQTLITGDGSTLLGADDKAGIAEIMTALEQLLAEKAPHGPLCIAFTPDEEIGRGPDHFDLAALGAQFAYTVDGGDVGELEYQNFNAAGAIVRFTGFSVHPGTAKNAMINAQNLAMEFHAQLPADERPEHTEGREGFYHLTSMAGLVGHAELGYIVRDHDPDKFAARKQTLLDIAAEMNRRYGTQRVQVELHDTYYNMEECILPHFHLIENAKRACRAAGVEPRIQPIRGGTDGAQLSFRGLPCPNLGTGGFNFHGVCECITVEKMDAATQILLQIIKLYAQPLPAQK